MSNNGRDSVLKRVRSRRPILDGYRRYVHSLHHKNSKIASRCSLDLTAPNDPSQTSITIAADPEPWSGLCMHPIEHLYYFSCTALPAFFLQSPFHGECRWLSPISSIFNQFLAGAALSDVQRAGESRGALIECVYVEVDASRGSG